MQSDVIFVGYYERKQNLKTMRFKKGLIYYLTKDRVQELTGQIIRVKTYFQGENIEGRVIAHRTSEGTTFHLKGLELSQDGDDWYLGDKLIMDKFMLPVSWYDEAL